MILTTYEPFLVPILVEPVRIELTSEKDPSPQSTGLSTALLIE